MNRILRRLIKTATQADSTSHGPAKVSTVVKLEASIWALMTYMHTLLHAKNVEQKFNEELQATGQLQFHGVDGLAPASAANSRPSHGRSKAKVKRKIGNVIAAVSASMSAKKRKSSLPQDASDFLIQWFVMHVLRSKVADAAQHARARAFTRALVISRAPVSFLCAGV